MLPGLACARVPPLAVQHPLHRRRRWRKLLMHAAISAVLSSGPTAAATSGPRSSAACASRATRPAAPARVPGTLATATTSPQPGLLPPAETRLAAAVLGIIGNQAVTACKRRAGRRINSLTLLADARHSWLDAIASLGALAGLAWSPPGSAGATRSRGSPSPCSSATSAGRSPARAPTTSWTTSNPATSPAAEQAATGIDGVTAATARGRWMGRTLILDLEAHLDPGLTLAGAQHNHP